MNLQTAFTSLKVIKNMYHVSPFLLWLFFLLNPECFSQARKQSSPDSNPSFKKLSEKEINLTWTSDNGNGTYTNPLFYDEFSDPDLIRGVRQGRKKEFEIFKWEAEPADPQDMNTFINSRLDWSLREAGEHKVLLDFYRELIQVRKNSAALSYLDKESMTVWGDDTRNMITVERWHAENRVLILMNMNGSIFLQIGEENRHRVRLLMDEVFGEDNFAGEIA